MTGKMRLRRTGKGLLLLLLMMLCVGTVTAGAAWKKNSDGTYSYYNGSGVLAKNTWISKTYYVNANGVMVRGWQTIGGKKYYFNKKNGKVVKNSWLKSGGKFYYAGEDGAIYTSGIYTIKNKSYGFNSSGVRLKGVQTFNQKIYYFKSNGIMLKKSWLKYKGNYYYFQKDGSRATSQWVGSYYVGSNGAKVVSQTIEIEGVSYKFDSKGKATKVAENKAPKADVPVESTYYSHKYVDEQTLLASIIYSEAGNQSYTGKLAVGLVIFNRVHSSQFAANTYREVIYAKGQFNPTWDGALARALNNPSLVTADCKKAAAAIMAAEKKYTSGKVIYIKVNGKKIAFTHLFFMTKASYAKLGLKSPYVDIGAHRFFTKWVK